MRSSNPFWLLKPTHASLIRFDNNILSNTNAISREMILRTASTKRPPPTRFLPRYVVRLLMCVSRCPYPYRYFQVRPVNVTTPLFLFLASTIVFPAFHTKRFRGNNKLISSRSKVKKIPSLRWRDRHRVFFRGKNY